MSFCPSTTSPPLLNPDPHAADPYGLSPPVITREYTGVCMDKPNIGCKVADDCLLSPSCITSDCSPRCVQFDDPNYAPLIYAGVDTPFSPSYTQ